MLMTFLRWAPLFWLIAAILLGILEAATVDLVAIWFAAGALAARPTGFCGECRWNGQARSLQDLSKRVDKIVKNP